MTDKILVIDDDENTLWLVSTLLQHNGFTTVTSGSSAEGLKLAQDEQPDMVLLDVMMPELDGWELCRRIRGDARHDRYTYLMVLTQLGGKKNYLEAMDAGADDFLTKPFDPDELVTRLRVAERILGMEATLGYLEALVECCPGCQRVRQANGRWVGLRQVAEGAHLAPATRCPECVRKESAGRARGPGRGAA